VISELFPVAVIESDGRLLADGLRVTCCDGSGRLSEDTSVAFANRWPWLQPEPFKRQTLNTRHLRLKTCRRCQQQFVGHWRSVFCSTSCTGADHLDYLAGRRQERKERRDAQKERRNGYTAPQYLFVHRCEHCRIEIHPQRSTRRFCSDRCRKAASRATGFAPTQKEAGHL
jgi:endogenous inhibitor of DNA gyrase (YacG/DUF329 family)